MHVRRSMISLTGAIIIAFIAACGSVCGQGMVGNPTFDPDDSGLAPAQWRFVDFGTGGTPAYDPDGGRNGTGAAGIVCESDAERGAWQQNVPLEGRTKLIASGWYRTEGMQGESGAMLRLTWLRAEEGWDFIGDVRLELPASEEWAPFEALFMAPEDAVAVAPELFCFYVKGTVWWDSIQLREATREEIREMAGQNLDRAPEPGEVDYAPADGELTATNPPAFVWLPVEGAERYALQFAPGGDFDGPAAITVEDWGSTVYTPHELLAPGEWAWRYGIMTEAGPVYGRTRQFTIPADAQPFPLPRIDDVMAGIPNIHPRAYFHRDDLDELRRKVREDPDYAEMAEPVIRNAESQIGQDLYPEPDYLPESGIERSRAYQECFRTMRPFTAGMETCAKAYILTGDERFGNEARRRLMHFMTWDPEGPTSVWNNDEAAMDLGKRAPRTYDWIYDLLSDQERETCRRSLGRRVEQMNELHRRMPFTSRPYSSHPGRMIGFVVEDSIILAHEVPQAREWLDYTLRLLWSVYPAWGTPDGGWAEGPGYWNAYIGMLQPTVLLLDNIGVPFKNKPFCQNNGWFGLYAVPVGGRMTPFGDGHSGSVSVGFGYTLYRWSTLYRNPYWRWYAEALNAGPGTQAGQFGFYDPTVPAKPPTDIPQGHLFPGIGLACMHSDLASPDRNVYMLLRSSPYGSVSHSHASQNAFAIGAYGEALAISSGYYQLYGSPHHAQWTWETRAHNSILVDGEGQVKRSPRSRGHIVEFDDQPEYCYTVGDATEAYGGRLEKFLRRVLFIRPDTFVICDELESAGESTYQWLLHARNEMQLDQQAQSVVISSGDARLTTQILHPAGLQFSQMEGFPVAPEREAPDQFHFTAETTQPAPAVTFYSVLSAWEEGSGERVPQAGLIEGEGGAAVELRWDDEIALIVWKLSDAAEVRVGAITSDADVAVLRRDPAGELVAVYTFGAGDVTVGG